MPRAFGFGFVLCAILAAYGENSGGGMRAGRQGKLFEEGNAYLDR